MKRDAEVLAGLFVIGVTLRWSGEVLQQCNLASLCKHKNNINPRIFVHLFVGTYLSEEPEHLEWPEAGESIEKKRVGVRRVASVENPKHDSETFIFIIRLNYFVILVKLNCKNASILGRFGHD